jgi:KDO2-lipid IV(A) lauroyltransferase
VILTGHLGQWELMSQMISRRLPEREAAIVTRYLSNPLLEDRLVHPYRTATGVRVLYKDKALLGGSKTLRRGGMLGLLIDQKIGVRDGVEVEFLGQQVLALASSAHLQMRLDADAMGVFLLRDRRGYFRLVVTEPVPVDEDATAEGAVERLVQRHQDVISEMVRAYPEQWFWMHDRFRMGDQSERQARIRQRIAAAARQADDGAGRQDGSRELGAANKHRRGNRDGERAGEKAEVGA